MKKDIYKVCIGRIVGPVVKVLGRLKASFRPAAFVLRQTAGTYNFLRAIAIQPKKEIANKKYRAKVVCRNCSL